jgi:chromosome segregation ATPase
MKTAIPWILVVGLLAGVIFLYSSGRNQDAELARLRQDNAEVDSLRAENEQLKKIPDQSAEIARLQKENEDLLRLRGEVSQLRQQNQQVSAQLQAAQAQNGQVLQQQQQIAAQNEALRAQTQQMQQAQAQAQTDACINNLRLIDSAKQQWALENKKPAGAIPAVSDLAPYFPSNSIPVCPAGGTYSINEIGAPPSCTVPGHILPRQN